MNSLTQLVSVVVVHNSTANNSTVISSPFAVL
jgi:hypothetical protein